MKSEFNDENSILWKRLEGVYNKTFFNKEDAKENLRSRLLRKKRALTIWKYSAAASIVLIIGLSFLLFNSDLVKQNKMQLFTSGNSVREINLPDSSTVWLNSNSTLSLPENFSSKHRKLFLKGEAFFEVHKDKNHSFRVFTGNSVTEVLGTSFNIISDSISGNTGLLVSSGKVAFYSKGDKKNRKILTPGEYAIYDSGNNNITLLQNPNPNCISWKTGTLKFYNTPIEEVCRDLSKHFKKNITSDEINNNLKLTGTFYNDSLEDILATIRITLDIEFNIDDNQYSLQK